MEYENKFGIIEAALFLIAIVCGLIYMATNVDFFFYAAIVLTAATIFTIMLECMIDG